MITNLSVRSFGLDLCLSNYRFIGQTPLGFYAFKNSALWQLLEFYDLCLF